MKNKRWKRQAKRLIGTCINSTFCGGSLSVQCPQFVTCHKTLEYSIPSDYDHRTLETKCKRCK